MPLIDEIRAKRHEILAIAARHGASHVRLFGSVARGEEKKKSDIDFLIKIEKGRTYFDLIHLEKDLKKALGRQIDVLTDEEISPYVWPYVEKDIEVL